MTAKAKKNYDCVASVREIRDRLSAKLVRMSPEEQARWFNTRTYSNPILQRLAAANRPSRPEANDKDGYSP